MFPTLTETQTVVTEFKTIELAEQISFTLLLSYTLKMMHIVLLFYIKNS